MLFEERIELMRKAKVAAIVLGSVSSCLFGGLFAVYATAPTVTSVTPKNTAQIQDVEIEELANAAAVTPIRTTAVTTSKATTKAASTTTAVTTTTTTVVEQTTEAPTEAPTQAATETVTEAVTNAPVEEYAAYVPEEPEVVYYDEPLYTEEETVEEVTTDYTQSDDTYVETPAVDTSSALPISDEEYIILCNAVGHEAGCSWISEYDKAKVVEVIMNRVYSPLYPNSIYEVLTQRYQFEGAQGYVNLGTYASYVTDSVKNAVNLYFTDPGSFQHGYFSFYGDGYQNYFV